VTYLWVAPLGVTVVAALAVGAGAWRALEAASELRESLARLRAVGERAAEVDDELERLRATVRGWGAR
jgi:hypothetical protein